MSFTIQPGTADDLIKSHENGHAAFEHDTNTLFKMHEQGTDDMNAFMPLRVPAGGFPELDPTKEAMFKAVDDKTGEMIGSVRWGFYNLNGDLPAAANATPLTDPIDRLAHPLFPKDETLPKWKQYENEQSAHLFTVQDRARATGKPVFSCWGINVHPKAQGRGVGTALVAKSTELADKHHAMMWVHTSNSPGVVKTFERNGFRVLDALSMDMDEWAEKPMPEGRDKWGVYTWSACVRDAR